MTDDIYSNAKPNTGRMDVSRGAIARKIGRLPPGEHLVELRARAVSDQTLLRVAGYSTVLQAGTVMNLDKIFGQPPSSSDARGMRAYAAQGSFWHSLLSTCDIQDGELQDITLDELSEKISGKQAIAIINESGFWSRVRSI
jgi:hypothetical protein